MKKEGTYIMNIKIIKEALIETVVWGGLTLQVLFVYFYVL